MGMPSKKQTSLIAGLGAGAALVLFTGAGRAARSGIRRNPARTNHRLAARVCMELDHRVEHPRGIQVFADDNRVILRGVALREELPEVLSATSEVDGVDVVTNQLEIRNTPGRILALQS